jgi:hypothetical protein
VGIPSVGASPYTPKIPPMAPTASEPLRSPPKTPPLAGTPTAAHADAVGRRDARRQGADGRGRFARDAQKLRGLISEHGPVAVVPAGVDGTRLSRPAPRGRLCRAATACQIRHHGVGRLAGTARWASLRRRPRCAPKQSPRRHRPGCRCRSAGSRRASDWPSTGQKVGGSSPSGRANRRRSAAGWRGLRRACRCQKFNAVTLGSSLLARTGPVLTCDDAAKAACRAGHR